MTKYLTETTKGKASVGSGFRVYSLSWQGRHWKEAVGETTAGGHSDTEPGCGAQGLASQLLTSFLKNSPLTQPSKVVPPTGDQYFKRMSLFVVAVEVVMVGFRV